MIKDHTMQQALPITLPASPQVFSFTEKNDPTASLSDKEEAREVEHICRFSDWLEKELKETFHS